MIKFIEKQFGNKETKSFSGNSETAIRDLIKLILMSEACSQDIPHWSKVSATSILNASKNYKKRPRCYVFMGILSWDEKRKVGSSELEKYLTKPEETTENYVRRLWKDIYNQKKSGEFKYPHLMSPKPTDAQVEDILAKLRRIALRLAGQGDGEGEINYKSPNLDKMDLRSLSEAIREVVK